MSLLIRPICAEDAPALAALEREIFSMPWSEAAFAALPGQSHSLYLVAQSGQLLVGCAGLTVLGSEGDIDKVMVRAAFRGQGIASALLAELMNRGEALGIRDFTLEVRAGNRPAIGLYEKFGFVSEGVRPGFYRMPTEDAKIMWRRQ